MINFAHANSLDQKMLLIWIRENSCFAQRMNKQCVLIFTSLIQIHAWHHSVQVVMIRQQHKNIACVLI